MKKECALLLISLGLSACQPQSSTPQAADQVNPLVGNAGYVAATGRAPTTATNDDARVQTHLAYAEQVLRQQPTTLLNPALARRRAHLLDLLHRYWVVGVFPRNFDHPGGRRPCFIDRDGRLCAVGYLVAETAGRPAAERINQTHQYDLIADMRTPALAKWVETSGLTRMECALIQPTYGNPGPPLGNPVAVSEGYAVGSAAWGAINLSLGVFNASQFNQSLERGLAYSGLVSGAGEVLFGFLHLPADEPPVPNPVWGGYASSGKIFAEERAVSYLNIGLGTATTALSAWNLLHHRHAQAPRTAINVVSFPGAGTGLALTRRF